MAGHLLQDAPLPAVIFHELRRQLDGIPFDAVDARDAKFLNACQQVVQAVAGFVKQRRHFVVREGCRLAADRAREVAGEIGNGFLNAIRDAAAGHGFVHPRTAALGFARIKVEVKLTNQVSGQCFDAEEAHVLVPHRCAIWLQAYAKECFNNVEQPGHHLRLGEILLHFLFRKSVASLQQLLRCVTYIPRFERFQSKLNAREFTQLGNVFGGKRFGLDCQIAQKGEHLRHRISHLGNQ